MAKWTVSDMPSQHGRTAVVTGTGGLGYEDALALARAGADMIIAGRDARKGAEAVARVRSSVPNAKVRFEVLDLASLDSVSAFCARLRADSAKHEDRQARPGSRRKPWTLGPLYICGRCPRN